MGTTLLSTALTLIALTGGMFLLAKTQKDNLNRFFKFVAYFIIIVSLLNLACTGLHCMMRCYGKFYHYQQMHERCEGMEGCGMKEYDHGHGGYGYGWKKEHHDGCCDDHACCGSSMEMKDSCCTNAEEMKMERR